ncbi:MAG: succinate dehydrogenase cytochrome b subunit [Myxococcales bacterium]|nr:succinate dehydrogenase cytochrome b subunit [Myxococcales bacterium]
MSTSHRAALPAARLSIGRKVVMAATGLTLAFWTVLHLAGNLLVFGDPGTIDRYGAMLQESPLVWLMRAGLLGLIALHVGHAARLAMRSREASAGRPRRAVRRSSWSARGMRLGGLAIAAFTVYHLLHIYGPLHADHRPGAVRHNLVSGLSSPFVASVYLLATFIFASHLRHGLWSALTSLGLTRSRRVERGARVLAAAIGLGFSAPVLAVWLGALR